MKKDVFKHNEYEQIARLLSGEMDEAQEKSFRKTLMADPEKKKAFEELKKNWENIPAPDIFDNINTNSAWENLNSRITDNSSVHKNRTIPLWLKWAASWLIILTVGASIWLINRQDAPEENLYTLTTYDEDHTQVHILQDGSVVYLGNNTSFYYPEKFESTQRRVKIQGEAFFDISHNPLNPFLLETRDAIIEVLGTSFNIKTLENNTMELFVETGRVRVQLKEKPDKRTVVENGELLAIKGNQITKDTAPDNYNTAWRKHHMHFKDEKLENIVRVLNKNFTVNFDIEEEVLKERKLTVAFHDTSEETMAELISMSLNIDFELINESSIIFKSVN